MLNISKTNVTTKSKQIYSYLDLPLKIDYMRFENSKERMVI